MSELKKKYYFVDIGSEYPYPSEKALIRDLEEFYTAEQLNESKKNIIVISCDKDGKIEVGGIAPPSFPKTRLLWNK